MKKYVELLKKYNLSFAREVLYILLNCIDKNVDTYDDLINAYKDRKDFYSLKEDYKEFYDYMLKYFHSMDINKDIILHHKVIELVDIILENTDSKLQKELKMFISNIIDLIFIKYHLNIISFNTNEEIKDYLLKEIKDEKVVNLLVLLLLADTTLSNKDIENIPEEEFENIISTIILISIYICKGEK